MGWATSIVDTNYLEETSNNTSNKEWFQQRKVSINNVTPYLEFALAGKAIIQKGHDIALANVIDRFQDVRYVFKLPEVPSTGIF